MDLLSSMGVGADARCEAVPVGGNNRLWKVAFDDRQYALKHYFRREGGRDRLGAETQFLAYADMLGIRCVPRVEHKDEAAGAVLMDWIDGERPQRANADAVDQAMKFFAALQEGHGFGGELLIGAEACFSVEHHLACVENRLRLLEGIPAEEEEDHEALKLVREQVLPIWQRIRARIEDALPLTSSSAKCVSPSDFGFHNAIVAENGSLSFLDFEYAGWDDPAKMVCDFFCQPAVPVPASMMGRVLAQVLPLFPADALLEKRIEFLLPVYRLKWCAICLNEFLPERRKAREFAGRSIRKNEQLRKAEALVNLAGEAA